jgi:hypothetical protein
MDSWWDLGESSGWQGNELALYRITCAFCQVSGKFALHYHTERANSAGKKLNYDIFKCENCGNFQMVFWSGGSGLHDSRMVPWPIKIDKYPDAWPERIGNLWLQARRSQQSESWDAAAVMARSALQAALRHAQAEGKTLFQEIDNLGGKGLLPPTMVQWAHAIRLFGNDSAHPAPEHAPATQADVSEAMRFIGFLFEYLFELPARIAKFRPKLPAPGPAQPPA